MWTVIVILILVGLLLMILEVFVIPGSGVVGIVGLASMVVGIWLAYSKQGIEAGHITLGVTLAVNVIGLGFALRSKTWKRAMLKTVNSGKVNEIKTGELKVGEVGITISRCAPMGKAEFNNTYYEVSTLSEFIDQEKEIEIIRISGNKIYVKKTNN
ncbi:MAG TPA: NfeD family protein [Bacteroidales bacterium]|jgi:membrane-bound ClpP family serine protease|nr:NfeD family protein [Bacteroidales bacterium]|tara:strand:- start:32 stop:499 length:468 start_codon:yes stop_codon:yes gene_type:complete